MSCVSLHIWLMPRGTASDTRAFGCLVSTFWFTKAHAVLRSRVMTKTFYQRWPSAISFGWMMSRIIYATKQVLPILKWSCDIVFLC